MDVTALHAEAVKIEASMRDATPLSRADTLAKDIARARLTNSKTKRIDARFLFTQDDLRFCTHPLVAEYRAQTFACDTIIDVGCGIGVQAIAFARTCKHVIAIDVEERKIAFAQFNAAKAGATNIRFIAGDALQVLPAHLPCDVLFWDPARPAEEKRRSLDNLQPSFSKMHELSQRAGRFVVELPPRLVHVAKLPPGRIEYLSIYGKLNRTQLTLPGSGKRCVSLPTGETLDANPAPRLRDLDSPRRYLYVIDTGIVQAKMVDALAHHLGMRAQWAHYLTHDTLVKSAFVEPFEVLKTSSRKNAEADLRRIHAGRIRLRGRIEPNEYRRLKNNLERGLKGDFLIDCFLHEHMIILSRPAEQDRGD